MFFVIIIIKFVFLFCGFCFLFCVFSVFVLFLSMHIVVYFIFVYNFTHHCHRVDSNLQLINITYHNIS
jgi:hypothetical protein